MTNAPDSPPAGSAPVDDNPYAPQPGDEGLLKDVIYLDAAGLLFLESYPVQVRLSLTGNLPTPCHSLRIVVVQPDSDNKIAINAYSVANPDAICIQMLQPFSVTIALGSFATGHYTVWVNDEEVAEFDA
ncbi:MAG: hypothetical protein FJZ96_03935 [Chloroflexi bacterium]|nr:hypothetical protein [Chloroflexota bacterium]